MSIYRDRTTGEIKNRLQLKRETTMSLPSQWSDSVLDALNVDLVIQQEIPDYDFATQKVELNSTATQVNGEWVQGWTISTMTAQEQAENDAQARAAVRQHRDALLQQTDWRASSDLVLPTEWATYRQALRDITSQEGFPYTLDWPVEP
jgi:hypothetical protein